jgi:hypothetical protein
MHLFCFGISLKKSKLYVILLLRLQASSWLVQWNFGLLLVKFQKKICRELKVDLLGTKLGNAGNPNS